MAFVFDARVKTDIIMIILYVSEVLFVSLNMKKKNKQMNYSIFELTPYNFVCMKTFKK